MDDEPHRSLVQTRVSETLHQWIERKAREEGISSAAFLRRLIMAAHQQAQKATAR